MDDVLFEDYFRYSKLIKKQDLIDFTKASVNYALNDNIKKSKAKMLIVIGSKEQTIIKRSAELLKNNIVNSKLVIKQGYYHGQYSLNNGKEYVSDLLAFINEK